MLQFKMIVQPTDFSDNSLNAFRYSVEFARHAKAKLVLTHSFEKPYYTVASDSGGFTLNVDGEAESEIRQEIVGKMKEMVSQDFVKDVHIYEHLVTDYPAWQFYEDKAFEHADLIVMGTQGATGIIHGGLFGTNTERVIRHAPIPVLSVPYGASYDGIKRILFATDFNDPVDTFVTMLKGIQSLFDSEIIVGVVNTMDNFSTTKHATQVYHNLVKKHGLSKVQLVIHNDRSVEEGVAQLCIDNQIDLIAMLTHGRTGIAHLVKGSIAEDISANIKFVPLLTMKTVPV